MLLPRQRLKLARGANDKGARPCLKTPKTVGIDIGKNSFHVVGHDERGAIVLRQKWSRGQLETRFANMPPCDFYQCKAHTRRRVPRAPGVPRPFLAENTSTALRAAGMRSCICNWLFEN